VSELNDPRVLFSAERTLLAWNRTSLSIMAFGFIIERAGFLMGPVEDEMPADHLTFWLGLAFIALGSFICAYSSRQYSAVLNTLTPSEFPRGYAARWGQAINVIVAVLGMLLIAVMLLGRSW
jgi:putative membrane protein